MADDILADAREQRDGLLNVLAGLHSDDPDSPELCARLGGLSFQLWVEEERPEDLALAEEALERALDDPGEGPDWALVRAELGHVKAIRYDLSTAQDADVLQEAQRWLSEALEGPDPLPHSDEAYAESRALAYLLLARCSYARWAQDGQPALLTDALRVHQAALALAEPASEEETELIHAAAVLHLSRAEQTGDPRECAQSVGHYRTLLDEARPVPDPARVRFGLASALLLQGTAAPERRVLEEAKEQFGRAVQAAVLATGHRPEWAWEAEIRCAFSRSLLFFKWKDQAEATAAEVELRTLLADEADVHRLSPTYLDSFARLLFERAAARGDSAAQDRAITLLHRALDTWRPERDGPVAVTATFLAYSQTARYGADPSEARLRDVLRASALVLAEDKTAEPYCRLALQLGGSARHLLQTEHGVPASELGEDAQALGNDIEVMSALQATMQDALEGRLFLDYDETDDDFPGLTRAMGGAQQRGRTLEGMYRTFQSTTSPEDRAESALGLLMQIRFFDPHGTHMSDERLEELIAAVWEGERDDPVWQRRAHAIVAQVLLQREWRGAGVDMDRVMHHIEAAEAAAESAASGDEESGTGAHGSGLDSMRFMALHLRGSVAGSRDDLEAADDLGSRIRDAPHLTSYQRRMMDANLAVFQTQAALRRSDLATADRLLAGLRSVHGSMDPDDPSRIQIWAALEGLHRDREMRAEQLGAASAAPLTGSPTWTQLRRATDKLPRDLKVSVLGNAGVARATRAYDRHDYAGTVDALKLVQEAYDLADEADEAKMRYAHALGTMHGALAQSRRDPVSRAHHASQALTRLEEAFGRAGGPEHRMYAVSGIALGTAYRTHGPLHGNNRAKSRRVGLDALRGLAWAALQQSGTEHAAEAVTEASTQALMVAGWCLRDNAVPDAMRALEACRGLILHAGISSRTLPERLVAAGHAGLAGEWREAAAAQEAEPLIGRMARGAVPSVLRRRVLAALTGDDSAQDRLLDPPAPEEIGVALRALRQDALVYLVAADEDVPGTAVVVTSTGDVHAIPLPLLTSGAAPLRDHTAAAGSNTARDLGPVLGPRRPEAPSLRRRLDRLCDWAWYAALRPLLDTFETVSGRPPRLVFVPMGELGLVPWHAAWTHRRDGRRLYALQQAEISYAASARLLCEVAARPAVEHSGAALIVGNPTGDLRHAGEEADAVQRDFYPLGSFLGRRDTGGADGAGTPTEVLDWLAGVGDGDVLHLACHAAIARAGGRTAHLSLHGGELAAEELTDAVGSAGSGRLGLVVLAACRSHVSGRGHDEAFSLATAFLAAGARSVIGSLWPVPDDATSVLMYLTHHYLRTAGESPAQALRRAQLWMLDPDHEVPPGMPSMLAERAARVDPDDLTSWAGFTHLGR